LTVLGGSSWKIAVLTLYQSTPISITKEHTST
jgi:hypothetical protein